MSHVLEQKVMTHDFCTSSHLVAPTMAANITTMAMAISYRYRRYAFCHFRSCGVCTQLRVVPHNTPFTSAGGPGPPPSRPFVLLQLLLPVLLLEWVPPSDCVGPQTPDIRTAI